MKARRDAFHEAGHGVVGYILGAIVERVRGLDSTLTYDTDTIPPVDQVAICRAGVHAGDLSGIAGDPDETITDECKALEITNRAHRDDPTAGDALYRDGDRKAATIVNEHAQVVAALAEAILSKGVLDRDYLERFFAEHLKAKGYLE